MSIISLLKIEFMKQKRNFTWKLTFIMPLICFFILIGFWHLKGSELISSPSVLGLTAKSDILLFTNHLTSMWFLFSAFTFSLIALNLNSIEYNENSWKYILSLPISKTKLYFSKWLVIFIFCFISIILNSIGIIIIGFMFNLQNYLSFGLIVKYIFSQTLSSMSIISFGHFIGSYFKNIIISLSITIVGILNTFMFSQSKILSLIIPYVPIMNCVPYSNNTNSGLIPSIAGLTLGILWLLIGIVEFNKKDIQ